MGDTLQNFPYYINDDILFFLNLLFLTNIKAQLLCLKKKTCEYLQTN